MEIFTVSTVLIDTAQKKPPQKHETWECNDHDYCSVKIPNKYNKILKYNHGEKNH